MFPGFETDESFTGSQTMYRRNKVSQSMEYWEFDRQISHKDFHLIGFTVAWAAYGYSGRARFFSTTVSYLAHQASSS